MWLGEWKVSATLLMLSSDMYHDDDFSRTVNEDDGDDEEDYDDTYWITSTSTSTLKSILTVKLRRGATPYGGIRLTDTCNHDGLTDVGSG